MDLWFYFLNKNIRKGGNKTRIYSKIGKHSFTASQQTCFLYFDIFWSLFPMNGLRMQTVRLDIHIKPVNINLLSASFVPIIPVFLFSLFFFLSTRRNIHFLPFKPGWYLNRTIVFLHSPVSREKIFPA